MNEPTMKTGGTSRKAICSTFAENKTANSSPQATATSSANNMKTITHRCILTPSNRATRLILEAPILF